VKRTKPAICHTRQYPCKKEPLHPHSEPQPCFALQVSFAVVPRPSRIVVHSFLSENSDLLVGNLIGCTTTFEDHPQT